MKRETGSGDANGTAPDRMRAGQGILDRPILFGYDNSALSSGLV